MTILKLTAFQQDYLKREETTAFYFMAEKIIAFYSMERLRIVKQESGNPVMEPNPKIGGQRTVYDNSQVTCIHYAAATTGDTGVFYVNETPEEILLQMPKTVQ